MRNCSERFHPHVWFCLWAISADLLRHRGGRYDPAPLTIDALDEQ